MIDHDMRENTNGVITLPDVTVQMVSVFRTVLYTGHANPADWNGEDGSSPPVQILLGVATLAKRYIVAEKIPANQPNYKGRGEWQ